MTSHSWWFNAALELNFQTNGNGARAIPVKKQTHVGIVIRHCLKKSSLLEKRASNFNWLLTLTRFSFPGREQQRMKVAKIKIANIAKRLKVAAKIEKNRPSVTKKWKNFKPKLFSCCCVCFCCWFLLLVLLLLLLLFVLLHSITQPWG